MSAPRGSGHRRQEVRSWQAGAGKGAAVVRDAARGALSGGPAEDPTFGDPLALCWAQREPGLLVSGMAGARGQASSQGLTATFLWSEAQPSPRQGLPGPGSGQVGKGWGASHQPPQRPRRPRCFRPVLAHVQLLWELMLLGEPLLVLAPSPAVSSEMVLALTRWVGRQREGPGAPDHPGN